MARKRPLKTLEAADSKPRFIAYYRVSTDKQGASGLGLEAQQAAVEKHVRSVGGRILEAFREVESGKRNDRPQIAAAIAACRAGRATLVIAKLDRLARNVAFIANLKNAGISFVACDNPHATDFTVHILAAVAEFEAKATSERTKAALQAAKARGVKLGNPRLQAGDGATSRLAAQVRTTKAERHAADVLPAILRAQQAGCRTLSEIAEALTARGIRTPANGDVWFPTQVSRILKRNTA